MAEEFVNRRGKRTKVIEQLDDPAIAQVAPPKLAQPKHRPRRNLLSALLRRRPHIGLRGAVVLVITLLLVGVVIIVSADSVKRNYERQVTAMRNAIAAAGATVPSADKKASAVSADLVAALKAPVACTVPGIDVVSWYGPAKTARDDCRQTAERYRRLREHLETMRSYATYLERIDAILAPALAPPPDGAYAIADDYTDAWTTSAHDLHTVTPPVALTMSHKTLTQRADELRDGWTVLQTALNNRDAAGFSASELKLTKAYDNFRLVANDIQTVVQRQQDVLTQTLATPS